MRKTLMLSAETMHALRELSRDLKISAEALGEEALRLLFKKHNHPANLQEALRMSLRRLPTNDNKGRTKRKA